MPCDDPDPQDPTMLVGVEVPGGAEAQRLMAAVFAEEFARLGFDEERILRLFHNPFYAGAHAALKDLGEEEIRRLVGRAVEVWGRVRCAIQDAPDLIPIRRGGL